MISLFDTKENVYHLEGVSDEEIIKAEEKLGLTFAEEYTTYLKEFGLLSYGVHELTGICKSIRLNVVDATIRERAENLNIPAEMYLIEQVGVENMSIWQNSRGEIFETAYKAIPQKIYDSLEEYIINS